MPGSRTLRLEAALARSGFQLDVSIEVAEGETAALVGPSGAGKSTCLSILTGLVRPDRGHASFAGETWCDTERGVHTPPRDRLVGFVGQDFALFPHLDVRGNVAYGPRARGLSRSRARAEADAWLDRLGLSSHAGLPVGSLSVGQRQRVALARALASGARVLLLDEPFASLDVATRAAVRAELHGFLEDVRLPALFVTHDAADALSLAGRIFVLEAGRVTQSGTCEELLSHPRTPFVAALFGLNHFRAELWGGGDLREARSGPIAFHVLAHGLEGSVWLAFPPSSVTLSEERPHGSAQNTFRGTIRDVLPLADRVRVTIDCGAAIAADVVKEAAAALEIAPGRALWASVKSTAIEVYP